MLAASTASPAGVDALSLSIPLEHLRVGTKAKGVKACIAESRDVPSESVHRMSLHNCSQCVSLCSLWVRAMQIRTSFVLAIFLQRTATQSMPCMPAAHHVQAPVQTMFPMLVSVQILTVVYGKKPRKKQPTAAPEASRAKGKSKTVWWWVYTRRMQSPFNVRDMTTLWHTSMIMIIIIAEPCRVNHYH